ncbi:hypothetical protein ACKWTF_006537 [Chironomus riparius]
MDIKEIRNKFKYYFEKAYNYEEAINRQKIDHNDVVRLRQKLVSFPHVPLLIHDKILLIFLNGCEGDIEAAAKRIESYYNIKNSSPELFWNRDPESKELQFSFQIQQMATLPISPDNCVVFIHRTVDTDPHKYHYDDVFKMFMMMAEIAIFTNGPRNGSIFISDWTGAKFGHLFRASISSIRKSLDFVQNAIPMEIKAVHILNSSYLIQVLFSIIRPFMKKELYDIIHIHPSNLNYEEFFEKHVPRHCMPADYGGDLQPLKILHSKNVETLLSYKEYFYLEELYSKQEFDQYTDELLEDSKISFNN